MITDIKQLDFNKLYTYQDYLTWSFKERVEIIKGRIFKMSPAPSLGHQAISREIEYYMVDYFKKNNKSCQVFNAPFDVMLLEKSKPTVVQPDICIVCDDSKLNNKGIRDRYSVFGIR